MVRKGKWIADSSPDEPVQEVARRALATRFDLVWHYLPRAAAVPEVVENVHQLRVATRRAMAAMQIFEHYLPPRRAVWMNRQLKRVRKAAGDARDLDVLIERLAGSDELDESARKQIIARLERLRADAQKPIEKIRRKLRKKDFPRQRTKLVGGIRLRQKADQLLHPTLAAAARRTLGVIVEEFFAASEGDFSDYAALHAFRIEGKQLRYAMEIFAGAFPPEFRGELYPIVEQLQEKLGKINDHATAWQLFASWLADDNSGADGAIVADLVAAEKVAMAQSREAFLEWWTHDRCADLRHRFRALLGDAGREQTA